MTVFSMVVNASLLVAIFWLLYREARDRYKSNRRVNVYIDETNKIAIVSPNKKASDKDINIIAKQLNGLYKTVLRVGNEINLKGLKRK